MFIKVTNIGYFAQLRMMIFCLYIRPKVSETQMGFQQPVTFDLLVDPRCVKAKHHKTASKVHKTDYFYCSLCFISRSVFILFHIIIYIALKFQIIKNSTSSFCEL